MATCQFLRFVPQYYFTLPCLPYPWPGPVKCGGRLPKSAILHNFSSLQGNFLASAKAARLLGFSLFLTLFPLPTFNLYTTYLATNDCGEKDGMLEQETRVPWRLHWPSYRLGWVSISRDERLPEPTQGFGPCTKHILGGFSCLYGQGNGVLEQETRVPWRPWLMMPQWFVTSISWIFWLAACIRISFSYTFY